MNYKLLFEGDGKRPLYTSTEYLPNQQQSFKKPYGVLIGSSMYVVYISTKNTDEATAKGIRFAERVYCWQRVQPVLVWASAIISLVLFVVLLHIFHF